MLPPVAGRTLAGLVDIMVVFQNALAARYFIWVNAGRGVSYPAFVHHLYKIVEEMKDARSTGHRTLALQLLDQERRRHR